MRYGGQDNPGRRAKGMKIIMNGIMLGEKVRDKITGLEGIATARVEYLNGCVQICVTPPAKDGKTQDREFFDVQMVEVIGPGVTVEPEKVGGHRADAPSGGYGMAE